MNFCPKCRFMLYTKRVKDESSDSDKYILKNYCKNCSWEGEYTNISGDKVVVYKRNYTNEFLTEKSLLSQHTINDPTLPRISNIKCVNDKCLTNLDIEEDNVYHGKDLSNDQLTSIELQFTNTTKLNPHEILITPDDSEQEVLISVLSEYGDKITKFKKPKREIIFMKYDPINLKYLYICSTCKTTWKND